MPAFEDWLNDPLSIINNIYASDASNFDSKVKEYFENKLKVEKSYHSIPCLNEVALHDLKPNCLVRYRCMIQDSFDPVYYIDKQKLISKSNPDDVIATTLKYKESLDIPNGYEVVKENLDAFKEMNQDMNGENDDDHYLKQRITFYCVPIPGETEWIRETYKSNAVKAGCNPNKFATSNAAQTVKRTLDSDEENDENMKIVTSENINNHLSTVRKEKDEETTVCKICLKMKIHSDQAPNDDIEKTVNFCKKTKVVKELEETSNEETESTTGKASSNQFNFPLETNETGRGCLVKVYDNFNSYKINDCVEFIGVLVQDPGLAYEYDEHDCLRDTSHLVEQTTILPLAEKQSETNTEIETETIKMHIHTEETESEKASNNLTTTNHCKCTDVDISMTKSVIHKKQTTLSSYPPSLVPRLHCIKSFHLIHDNPLLTRCQIEANELKSKQHKEDVAQYWNGEYFKFLKSLNPNDTIQMENLNLSSTNMHLNKLRNEIVAALQELLLGDSLAAEYLLMHLISSVYARKDVTVLGKFALNITNIPRSEQEKQKEQDPSSEKNKKDNDYPTFAKCFYNAIKQFLSMTHLFQLTTDNLNKSNLIPGKDYNKNKLISGMLQLPDNFELVIDETQLNAGELKQKGLMNFSSIKEIIQWQKISYDFVYHRQEFNTDIKVLILSQTKSILPFDCQLKLNACVDVFDQTIYKMKVDELMAKTELVDNLRKYINIISKLDYKLNEKMTKLVEDDIVQIRKNKLNTQTNEKMSVEDFHLLLVIARLQTLSYGKNELSIDEWNRAKSLEFERLKQKI